jgi:hypothetical protein
MVAVAAVAVVFGYSGGGVVVDVEIKTAWIYVLCSQGSLIITS